MTKIEELEQKLNEASSGFEFVINEIRKELVCYKTQKELKESKKESKWKPAVGETYWFRNDYGESNWSAREYGDLYDEWRLKNIPLFKTKEECERYWRFMDAVKEKSYEFSELDWRNDDIKKWVIQYDYMINQLVVVDHLYIKQFGMVYFKDEESAQYIIDNFKDELMEFIL